MPGSGRPRWLRLPVPLHRFKTMTLVLGVTPAIKCALLAGPNVWPVTEWRLHPRAALHPLFLRASSSDREAFLEIFLELEYSCLDDLREPRLIIDCGANAGYSSAYFLSRFPESRVIAVEPDSGNFALLSRNMAPYAGRASLVRAGVWSHSVPLVVTSDTFRDGREWARQVRPARDGEAVDLQGVDIASLLASSGFERISLLKMDIEGAEAVVFAGDCDAWLDKVDAMAIELHDDSSFGNATDVFFAAIRGRGFEVSHSRELTICRRS
jgi:FkbM family methyltransferase